MKRLVLCFDGTWQKLSSSYPTNVVKIAQSIKLMGDDGVPQLVFYDEGIGTGQYKIDRYVGGGFGKGIDQNIQDGYRFLSLNYVKGDEIYLFGFSRGAYTARSLAGLIHWFGIPGRQFIRLTPQAYEIYRTSGSSPERPEAVEFRQQYSIDQPDITLLACWDTVGSLGLPNVIDGISLDENFNKRYQFYDTNLGERVKCALHAVAIDEQRSTFDATLMQKNPQVPDQILRQVWFPGDHGSIGGGEEPKRGLSDGALQWMIDSIQELKLGLSLDPNMVEDGIKPDYKISFAPDQDQWTLPQKIMNFFMHVPGASIRALPDSFEDLHLSVKQRWKAVGSWRPQHLQQQFGTLLDQWSG